MTSITTSGIKLEPTIKARLSVLGKLRDRTPHWLMKRAIVEYLEREEAYEHERREDEARYQRYITTGNHQTQAQMDAWIDKEIAALTRAIGV